MIASLEKIHWTNESVLKFAGDSDPVPKLIDHVSDVVLQAMDAGWSGPPFDPIELAEHLGIGLVPNARLADARTRVDADGHALIEFNPNRAPTRIRFNIAHEIGHTLFPDFAKSERHRDHHRLDPSGDTWQLELLCNLAAAEILMPEGSIPTDSVQSPTIDRVLELKEQFNVSVEAVLVRLVNIMDSAFTVFAASYRPAQGGKYRYSVDYSLAQPRHRGQIRKGTWFRQDSVVSQCTAIGYTAKGWEPVKRTSARQWIECVGLPPYPGGRMPRVAGLALDETEEEVSPSIVYVLGDALERHEEKEMLIVHIINDKTPNWGGAGFAKAVKKRWPEVAGRFRIDVESDPKLMKLGAVSFDRTPTGDYIGHMVAQHGYGASEKPRIRYQALKRCLIEAADFAFARNVGIRMPAIGTGNAGGDWNVIEALIRECLTNNGVEVTVCSLPDSSVASQARGARQRSLL